MKRSLARAALVLTLCTPGAWLLRRASAPDTPANPPAAGKRSATPEDLPGTAAARAAEAPPAVTADTRVTAAPHVPTSPGPGALWEPGSAVVAATADASPDAPTQAPAAPGAGPAGIPRGERHELPDGGATRVFALALDELVGRDPETGKDRVFRFPEVADRAALLREQARLRGETGLEPALVLYPEGRARNEFTRRVVTRQVLVQAPDRNQAEAAAAAQGLRFHSAPAYAPGHFVFTADSSPEALDAALALDAAGGVAAEPVLARQFAKRALPNDPLVGAQWHLKHQSQAGAVPGTDIRVESVWNYPGAGTRGAGVRVGVIDDGMETAHPDLAANADTANDRDWNDATPDTPEPSTGDDHGTACAGNVAARGNNGAGVSGSAPEATLVGMRLISAAVGDTEEGEAFDWRNDIIQVKSNSWGPNDDGTTLEGPGTLGAAALRNAAHTGRGGRGTLFLWAAGNGRDAFDNSNYDGYANSIYTIAVAAVDSQARQSWYSESGANVVVSAPSDGDGSALGITTTDRSGAAGYNSGSTAGEISGQPDYTQTFGGTSSATPTAAGVVALMLQANPNLGWRDVQEILIRSAARAALTGVVWDTNGAGISFSHEHGAGLIDAAAAVAMAGSWVNLGPHATNSLAQSTSTAIPDNNATGVTRSFNLAATNLRVEHAVLRLNVTSIPKGQLEVTLTSPAGTVSRLCETHDDNVNTLSDWSFMSVRHWGELSTGTWTLRVADRLAGTTGSLTSAVLTLYGSSATPVNPPPQVTLTSPAAGAVFSPGAPVTLAATATDLTLGGGAGTVTQVEFFAGTTSLGVDTTAPYGLTWTPPSNGPYTLQARGTDSEGAVGPSAAVSIQVLNQPPVITAAGLSQADPGFFDTALTVTGLVSSDPEGQPVTHAYQWQSSLNGTAWTNAPGAVSATLAPSAANGARIWRCVVTPNDGQVSGAAFTTATVRLHSRPVTSATTGQPYSYAAALYVPATVAAFTRAAIINEFSQGSNGGEWIELLTLGGSLRFHWLTDSAGPGLDFADDPFWDTVPAGTRIVIYNASNRDPLLPADDGNPADDGRMILPHTSPLFLGSWPALGNGGDSLELYDDQFDLVCGLGYGTDATTPPNIGAVGAGRAAYYTGDTETGVDLASNWTTTSGTVARAAPRVPTTLPVTHGGPWNTLPAGFTSSGTGTYTGSLGGDTATGSARFDSTGDILTVEFNAAAGNVAYNLLGNPAGGTATEGAFLVQESADGIAYTTLFTHTNKSNVDQTFSHIPASTTRFIRFRFELKVAGNIQLDKLSVTAAEGVTPGAGNTPANAAFAANLRNGSFSLPPQYRFGATSAVVPGLSIDAATGVISGTPSAGTYALVIERFNSLGAVFAQSFTLTVGAPSGYAAWIAGYSGLSSTLESADADGDGISNFGEYFMALHPGQPDAAGALVPAVDATGFSLTYRRSKTATGVTGAVTWNPSLLAPAGWSSAGVVDVPAGDFPAYMLRRATVPFAPGAPRLYLRLETGTP